MVSVSGVDTSAYQVDYTTPGCFNASILEVFVKNGTKKA